MKNILFIIIGFLYCTTLVGQVSNGSFENDSTSDLSNWEYRCYEFESSNISPPGGGNWSIKVSGGSFQGCFPSFAYQKIPTITNGQTFLLTGWVQGQSARLYFGKINSGVKTLQSGSTSSSDSWTKLSIQSTYSLSSGDTAIVVLHVGTMPGGGNVLHGYFDLINLELIPGINSLKQKPTLKLFPNPFNNQTTLSSDKFFHNATLTMTNTFGLTVKQMENINGKTIILKRDNLSRGLYFIQLFENNEIIASKKIIITD